MLTKSKACKERRDMLTVKATNTLLEDWIGHRKTKLV